MYNLTVGVSLHLLRPFKLRSRFMMQSRLASDRSVKHDCSLIVQTVIFMGNITIDLEFGTVHDLDVV